MRLHHPHGGNIAAFAAVCRCRPDEVIDLSSNINFVKPRLDIDFNALSIAPYPDYTDLYQAVAAHYRLETRQVWLTNGATAAIDALFGYLGETLGGSVILHTPIYAEYPVSAARYGFHVTHRPRKMTPDADTSLPARNASHLHSDIWAPAFVSHTSQASYGHEIFVIVNPATPDGQWYDIRREVSALLEAGHTVIVDESFIEFAARPSLRTLIARYENLFIIHSLTKYWGAAGVRVGALFAAPKHIDALRTRQPLWSISAFDSAYIQAALRDSTFAARSREANARAKAKLCAILRDFAYTDTLIEGEANFVLLRLHTIDAEILQRRLARYRILVRNCANFEGLNSRYVRLAVKDEAALDTLQEALRALT